MKVKIKYFGMVAELTQCQEEWFNTQATTIESLIHDLKSKYQGLENMSFKIAVNQELLESGSFQGSDEIAILPPFAGG